MPSVPPPPAEPEEDGLPRSSGLAPTGVITPIEPLLSRAQRPDLADELEPEFEPDEDWAEPPRRRGWLQLALAWTLAAVAGFGIAYLTAMLQDGDPEDRAPTPPAHA